MPITLMQPVAANSPADENDVRNVKIALNHLGYYQPYEKTGITGIPDRTLFDALARFQSDSGLPATASLRPGDNTHQRLSEEVESPREGKYIWRTAGDDKVRDAHAALDGTVRNWDDSPTPGEKYNCRCWAEPLSCNKEFITQNVISEIKDTKPAWTWIDYWDHFQHGNGVPVTLSGIGYLNAVINVAHDQVFPKVSEQVAALAKRQGPGPLYYTTINDYPFRSASYPLGRAVVTSETVGTVSSNRKCLIIDAEVTYNFSDTFTDPAELRDRILRHWGVGDPIIGTSDPNHPLFDEYKWTELGGTYFDITDTWKNKISGIIKRNL